MRRLGGDASAPVDFRLVSATNRNLAELVEHGTFRADLFYRLGAATVALPALRERRDDLPALIDLFNHRFARELGREPVTFSTASLDAFAAYSWPGNVRELCNEIWRLLATVPGQVELGHLARRVRTAFSSGSSGRPAASPSRLSLPDLERAVIGGAIRDALTAADGNVSRAARLLGVPRTTLYRKLERFGIDCR